MKTATVRELRTQFPRLESLLQTGETISITKHNRVVAELSAPAILQKPNFKKRFGKDEVKTARSRVSAVQILEEDRGS